MRSAPFSGRLLCGLHDTDRDGEGQAELRIGQIPPGSGLEVADAVRQRVAVDSEAIRGLAGGAVVQHRPERREPFAHARGTAREQRFEQCGRLHPVVGQAAQRGKQPIRRESVRARHLRRLRESLRGVERRACVGLLHGPARCLAERLAERHRPAEELRHAARDPEAQRVARLQRRDRPEVEALARAAEAQAAGGEPEPELLAHLLAARVAHDRLGLAGDHDDPRRPVGRERVAARGLVAGTTDLGLDQQLEATAAARRARWRRPRGR